MIKVKSSIKLENETRARAKATLMVYGCNLSSYTNKSDRQLINLYKRTRGVYWTDRLIENDMILKNRKDHVYVIPRVMV